MPEIATPQSSLFSQPLGGLLPQRMKVLYITTEHRPGGWLAEALATDSASEILLEESLGASEGLARLRDEVFDAVLIGHEQGVLDAVELVEGLRGGGGEEPAVVLGAQPQQELAALCFEVGADAYCWVQETTVRSLLWTVARAVERRTLIRENRLLVQQQRRRLHLEQQEATRLLAQQWSLAGNISPPGETSHEEENNVGDHEPRHTEQEEDHAAEQRPTQPCLLPDSLVNHYRGLLRAYVIMGTGNLGDEMRPLAEMFAGAGVTARQVMQLHLNVLEQLLRGLGNRSARHVMNRADLLVLELMVHLADSYRHQYLHRSKPLHQLNLPGFGE